MFITAINKQGQINYDLMVTVSESFLVYWLTAATCPSDVKKMFISNTFKELETYTRCAWAGGTCANYPDFFEYHQFHIMYCVTLTDVLFSKNFWFTIHVNSWFWRIIDRICWACAIFCSIPNLQACTDGRTDRQTDWRINPGWAG
jgi:hypothetical protein